LITVAVTDRVTSRYLVFNKYNRLCGWRNTATQEEKLVIHAPDLFNKAYSGIAIFEPEVFDHIPFTGKFSLIDVYLALAEKHKIAAFDHTGDRLIDVGKPQGAEAAEQMFP
jgi:NDP-sugar pyrophosphorylase family protein